MRIPVQFSDVSTRVRSSFTETNILTEYEPTPQIIDGYWWCYDRNTGEYFNTGVSAVGLPGPEG